MSVITTNIYREKAWCADCGDSLVIEFPEETDLTDDEVRAGAEADAGWEVRGLDRSLYCPRCARSVPDTHLETVDRIADLRHEEMR